MSEEIPQWAMAEAQRRLEDADSRDGEAHGKVAAWIVRLIARHIAQHEQPPVDPDVVAVREILISWHETPDAMGFTGTDEGIDRIRNGWHDNEADFQAALSAYRKHKEAGK